MMSIVVSYRGLGSSIRSLFLSPVAFICSTRLICAPAPVAASEQARSIPVVVEIRHLQPLY